MTTGYWSATSLAASTSTSWARVSGIPDTDSFSLYIKYSKRKVLNGFNGLFFMIVFLWHYQVH